MGVLLRELVQWGYLGHASLIVDNLKKLVRKNEEGYYTFPEYFKYGEPASGSELDGTAAIIIGMVLLWKSLNTGEPDKTKIYEFLNNDKSPIKFIIKTLKENPLIPGTGEFGGGCDIGGKYYNVVQNNLIRLALLAAADIEPETLKPDPEVINATMNKGFGEINGVISMYADVLGFEPLASGWDGIKACIKTFEKLLATQLRKEQFNKYGIWSQFDDICMGMLTSPSYGQGYALQAMLLFNRMEMAEKALNYLVQATKKPPKSYKLDRESDYYFYERYYSPDAVGKVELNQGCGALNLVNVAEPLKIARLIVGIDDTASAIVKIIPRVLPSWT